MFLLCFIPALSQTLTGAHLSLSACKHSSSPFSPFIFRLHSVLPLPIFVIYLSRSLNPPFPPLQRVGLICNADPLYLMGRSRGGSNGWGSGKMEGRKEGRSSQLPLSSLFICSLSLVRVSHSAVFNVNIFTALLITRTSGMALTNLFSPQDQIFICPPIVSLLISPKPSVFNPYIMSFLLLWLPLTLFLPPLPPPHILQLHNYTPILSLSLCSHSTYNMCQYICHIWVTLHMKLTIRCEWYAQPFSLMCISVGFWPR